ncbi:MAG: hypothetical protein QME61_01745 [Patescibacteria group bacterium]|nr:hypothetical protein [Patescibacteria group bacterium]
MNKLKFEKSRKKFQEIKGKLIDTRFKEQVEEFKKSLEKLILEYNTANWENRFTVGGALEILFCVLLNSIGFKAEWIKELRYDIKIDDIPFSLKGNFVSLGNIRLINILGEEIATWAEPTIFFISELGICYADPEMGLRTKHIKDALTINTREIKSLIEENEKWHIPISIPRKQRNSQTIKTASYDVAKSVLEKIKSKYLIKYLPKV